MELDQCYWKIKNTRTQSGSDILHSTRFDEITKGIEMVSYYIWIQRAGEEDCRVGFSDEDRKKLEVSASWSSV